jgi:hypothetical protein
VMIENFHYSQSIDNDPLKHYWLEFSSEFLLQSKLLQLSSPQL